MKVFSFKQFLEEEDTKAIVQTGVNSKSLDNNVTKEMLNAQLAKTTGHPFITPYIALGAIARVLAYANIILPQYVFLDKKDGEVVFDATQFGKMAGVNLDGSPANNDTEYFVYFSYSMNDDGYYDCFAILVDQEELDGILTGDDEDVDEVEETQEMSEEPTNPAAQVAQELKNRVAAHKKIKKKVSEQGIELTEPKEFSTWRDTQTQ